MNSDAVLKLRDDKVYQFGNQDSDAPGSLYVRVAEDLIQQAAASPGPGPMPLPQERDLAGRFKVSRSTIRQALALLEEYDLVQRRRGHGTLLTKPADEVLKVWRLRNKQLLLFQFSPTPIRHNDYYGRIVSGMVSVARTNHQSLEIKYCYYPGEVPRDLHTLPDQERVAGVLICGMYDDNFLKLFDDHKVPCICVDYWPHDMHTDAVTVDVEAEAFLAAAHLAQRGYRTVGFAAFGQLMTTKSSIVWDPDVWRFLGHLRRAANQYGLLLRDEWVQTVPGADHLAQTSMDRFFMLERLPEAVVCFGKDVAIRAVESLRRCNIRCPEDVGLITRGDDRVGNLRLTTLESRPEEIGRAAMRLMLERVYRKRTHPVRIAVASQLVVGESTRETGTAGDEKVTA